MTAFPPLRGLAAGLLTAALLSAALPARAADAPLEVGAVDTVKLYAYGTPPQRDKEALYRADPVYKDEVLETVDGGGLELKMQDGTQLNMGGASTMVVDEYVYRPNPDGTAAGRMAVNMAKGVFRFVTGGLPKEGYKFVTPTAEIGVRGTDAQVTADEKTTQVDVFSGEVELTGPDGKSVAVPAGKRGIAGVGQTTSVAGNARSVPSGEVEDSGSRTQGGSGSGGAAGGDDGHP